MSHRNMINNCVCGPHFPAKADAKIRSLGELCQEVARVALGVVIVFTFFPLGSLFDRFALTGGDS